MKQLLEFLLIYQFLGIGLGISKDKFQGLCVANVPILHDDGNMTTVQKLTCCKGFAYIKITNRCEPLCNNDCQNGRCIAPNTCKCDFDYEPFGEGENLACQWTGYESCKCINGECLPSGSNANEPMDNNRKITCCKGYAFVDIARRCEPICENGCHNGRCVAPNKCMCDNYYEPMDGNDASMCELTGQEICNCPNGYCLRNGECICNKGFIRSLSLSGHIKCESLKEFVGTILAMVLAIPLIFGTIILLIICWKKKKSAAIRNNKFHLQRNHQNSLQQHHNHQFNYDDEDQGG